MNNTCDPLRYLHEIYKLELASAQLELDALFELRRAQLIPTVVRSPQTEQTTDSGANHTDYDARP